MSAGWAVTKTSRAPVGATWGPPGDTLLFASDGFAEQLDAADQPLGYERVSEIFHGSAGVPARELVERLLTQVAAWRDEREQGDDVTLVAVRVTS